jgi:hypothetical protein
MNAIGGLLGLIPKADPSAYTNQLALAQQGVQATTNLLSTSSAIGTFASLATGGLVNQQTLQQIQALAAKAQAATDQAGTKSPAEIAAQQAALQSEFTALKIKQQEEERKARLAKFLEAKKEIEEALKKARAANAPQDQMDKLVQLGLDVDNQIYVLQQPLSEQPSSVQPPPPPPPPPPPSSEEQPQEELPTEGFQTEGTAEGAAAGTPVTPGSTDPDDILSQIRKFQKEIGLLDRETTLGKILYGLHMTLNIIVGPLIAIYLSLSHFINEPQLIKVWYIVFSYFFFPFILLFLGVVNPPKAYSLSDLWNGKIEANVKAPRPPIISAGPTAPPPPRQTGGGPEDPTPREYSPLLRAASGACFAAYIVIYSTFLSQGQPL